MTTRTEYRATLAALAPSEWAAYLAARSGLPGPRANLELAQAVADAASPTQLRSLAASADEYSALCGTVGLGRLLAERDERAEGELRMLAVDPRWRVREGVAMALQRLGDADRERLWQLADRWLDAAGAGAPGEQRGPVATPDAARSPAGGATGSSDADVGASADSAVSPDIVATGSGDAAVGASADAAGSPDGAATGRGDADVGASADAAGSPDGAATGRGDADGGALAGAAGSPDGGATGSGDADVGASADAAGSPDGGATGSVRAEAGGGSELLVLRAVAAGVAEPRLVKAPSDARRALGILDRITAGLVGVPVPDRGGREDVRVLRQTLEYAWSVAAVGAPEDGFAALERWAATGDPDARRIARANATRARLRRLDPARAAALASA